MHAGRIAKQKADIRADTQALAVSIGSKLGLQVDGARFDVKARDPKVRALRQEEAIRDFLSEIDSAVEKKTPAKKPASKES